MLLIGVVLIIIGALLGIGILFVLGVILAVIGCIGLAVGYTGGPNRRVLGRRYWY